MTVQTAPRAVRALLQLGLASCCTSYVGPKTSSSAVLQSPLQRHPGVPLPPHVATGMAVLLRSVQVAGGWLCRQAAVLDPFSNTTVALLSISQCRPQHLEDSPVLQKDAKYLISLMEAGCSSGPACS